MTFNAWLRTQTKRNDRVGDVARDCVAKKYDEEPRFPTSKLKSAYVKYLEYYGSDPAVVESMCIAFDEWGGGIDDLRDTEDEE